MATKKGRLVCTMLFVLVASCLSQNNLDEARRNYDNGSAAFQQHKWPDAESAFKTSYAQQAFAITAYFLSCTYVEMRKRSDAGHFAELALQRKPELNKVYSEGAQGILDWSRQERSLETDAKADSPSPNFQPPTENSFPVDDNPTPAVDTAQEGNLIKGSGAEVFLVVGGRRRWIPDEQTFDALGLDWQAVKTIPDQRLDSVPKGKDYPSLPGKLVKGSGPKVYLLENARRRWIPDMETLERLGLRWDDVRTIPNEDLLSVPVGAPIPR